MRDKVDQACTDRFAQSFVKKDKTQGWEEKWNGRYYNWKYKQEIIFCSA